MSLEARKLTNEPCARRTHVITSQPAWASRELSVHLCKRQQGRSSISHRKLQHRTRLLRCCLHRSFRSQFVPM
jgi:hypothetical protein